MSSTTAPGRSDPAGLAAATATVVVVGSLNIDLVAQAPHLPQPGETLTADGFAVHEGGKGGNQAVAAARFGARVAMLGCVGDDAHGRRLRQALQHDGIDCHAVPQDAHAPTGVALIVVARHGENSIVVVPGANAQLTPERVDAAAACITQARVLVAQLETPWPSVAHALALARLAGVTTVLNAAPAMALDAAQLRAVDWLIVNETEAQTLSGLKVTQPRDAAAAALALRALGPRHVVVTLGAQGLVHAADTPPTHWPACAETALDTTGAGDSFVGTLAASLAEGASAELALRHGQAAAALAITRRGAQAAMPTRAEVLARLAAGGEAT